MKSKIFPKKSNLVAKYLWKFNIPKVYRDKTKYKRERKHKGEKHE